MYPDARRAYRLDPEEIVSELTIRTVQPMNDGHAIPLSAAIGIATIEQGDRAEQVLIRADRAMYEEKAAA